MSAWPVTLPQTLLLRGYEEEFQDNVLRSPMEGGPPKQRRLYTNVPRNVAGVQILTSAQLITLENFYYTTLRSGVIPFTWTLPTSPGIKSFRFVAPYNSFPLSGNLYEVTYQFEVRNAA